MTRVWRWLALAALLAMPVSATAQNPRPGHESTRGLRGAVERLYEHRERLGITPEQLARVGEVKTSADVKKQPLFRRMMEVRSELKAAHKADPPLPDAERKALFDRGGAEIDTLFRQIRAIDRDAMEQVGDILTESQRNMLREIVRKSQGRRDDDHRRPPPDRGDRGV